MTTTVTESRPATHGKRLDGRRVIITNIYDRTWHYYGDYIYLNKTFFAIIDGAVRRRYQRADWTVEEIIERVE